MKMKMKSLFKNNSGFTLAEVVVTAGLIGALSVAIIQLSKNQVRNESQSKANLEINNVVSTISQTLKDATACTNTLGTASITNLDGSPSITEIRDFNNNNVYSSGQLFLNKTIEMTNIVLRDYNSSVVSPTKSLAQGNLYITFTKLSQSLNNGPGLTKEVIRRIPLRMEVTPGNILTKCISADDNAETTAKKEACEALGGTYNTALEECSLVDYANSKYGHPTGASDFKIYEGLSTRHLKEYKDNILNDNYINVTGDTVQGQLTVNADVQANTISGAQQLNAVGSITANNRLCVGANCRRFNQVICPSPNQVAWRINGDGSIDCTTISCPAGQFFEGLDPVTGASNCKPIPNNTCGANEFIYRVNPDGTSLCRPVPLNKDKICPADQFIRSISATGVETCVTDKNVFAKGCATGEVLVGFSKAGIAICDDPTPPVDGGWSSWSTWSPCTVKCGGGTRTRTRTCTNPVPQNGGAPCIGPDTVTLPCNTGSCCRRFHYSLIEKSNGSMNCGTLNRFMIDNDAASKTQICKEKGYDYYDDSDLIIFTKSEWCIYCNAKTTTWDGSSWNFHKCVNNSIKRMRCCKNP